MLRKERIIKLKDNLEFFVNNWRGMDDVEFNLWVYMLVINYGCYYFKHTSIDIVDIIANDEWTREEKFKRINKCFQREVDEYHR